MENKLLTNKHTLICIGTVESPKLTYIKEHFCGTVITDANVSTYNEQEDGFTYVCGDLSKFSREFLDTALVIKDLSYGSFDDLIIVYAKHVPINLHNVGVYFESGLDKNYFDELTQQHKFQALTESNKPTMAFRKGIYLTPVTEQNGELHFRLLRCSSNLDGPTENFQSADHSIVKQVNLLANQFFEQRVRLNHVLAQIYDNHTEGMKQKKAKIKAHSDKTKDMPRNGLMAFCTFYDRPVTDTGCLTQLKFKLKQAAHNTHHLTKEFCITLHPNSVFITSLEMNRLYTHEIKPSHFNIDQLPTRMGYVIRCSKTHAFSKDGQTFITPDIKLRDITESDIKNIRELYFQENSTTDIIDYESDGIIDVSMNSGDYLPPTL